VAVAASLLETDAKPAQACAEMVIGATVSTIRLARPSPQSGIHHISAIQCLLPDATREILSLQPEATF
jgi:hypothetical protein